MMAGVELSKSLDDSELEKIPSDLRSKIESVLSSKLDEFNEFKIKYEKLRVNSEQQYFDIEKQLITTNGKLEIETSQKASLQEKLGELETKYSDATKKLQELQESRELFQTTEHEYKSTIQLIENEKRDLNIIANKRGKEIEKLNEEITELNKRITAANNEKCEALAKLSENQAEEVSRQYREKRLEKEKEQLEKQVEWYNEQLTEKTNQLSSVRKEKGNNVLELQSQLDEKTQELTHLQTIVESMKQASEEQNKKIESFIEKLKEERDSQVQVEEQFRQELAVQKRLTELYKASSEENDKSVSELTGAVEELRKLLAEASTAYTELESSKLDEINKLESKVAEKEEAVLKLEEELKNANDLMISLKKGAVTLTEDAVETLSPAAAATSKLLKSGMSLTQIYNEYVQATDALAEEREENKRLNSYLEQILQEIQEKAPLLKKQREDYETALTNLDQMSSQLDKAMLECEKLRTDADDMRRRFGHVQRECAKQEQTSQDLSKQVHHLLKEVEELRGGRVVREDMDISSSEISSSSNIITEKLVTFRNIEELQQQNQRLIGVARELSEKKETEEREATEEKTRELKEQLEFAMNELELLKEARSRQAEMVESIVRQRDMYRVLLQQNGSSQEVSTLAPLTSTPMPTSTAAGQEQVVGQVSPSQEAARKKELEEAKNALKELKSDFEAYKKDKAENEKLQNETLEKVRQNLSDMRADNTKLSTQLDFATERYKILQSNIVGYKKEIDSLQERNQMSSSTIVRQESAIQHMKNELLTAQENVARWQVQVEHLKSEKELIKNSERRLTMELESMRREQTSQQMLMASLQAIQNNQERAEFESRTRHNNQVDSLQAEISSLRRKLESLLEEKTRQATAWEDIVKTVHLELAHEKEKQATLQTKADNAVLELETVKQELSTCEAKLAAAELKLEKLATQAEKGSEDEQTTVESRVETEAVKDLKNQMAQQQILIKNLRQQIETAKKHANQYKTIADGVEQSMKEQAEVMKEVQNTCEKKIQEAKIERDTMAKKLELLEKELVEANSENNRLSSESNSLHGDLRKQLTKLQAELEEAISQKNAAVKNSELAQADCKRQADIASEAQDKYQRELMLHAADVEALAAVRKQLEDINEHLQQSQEETIIYEKQLGDAKTSWTEQERILKEELKVVELRCEELTKQNTVLHEQMAKLSSQVVSIQQTARRDSRGGATSLPLDESGKTSDQLLEVIKFLRREKDIAETKLQVVETECNRVKQRFTHVEKQAEEATKALAEERQRSQVNAETVANQVELMRKVSNLNVLTDSNKLLRDERDQLLNNKQELQAKIQKLESDIEPLQAKLREQENAKDNLTVERDSLQEELNRWKNRTSNLIEQSHKTDPEEHKRLLQERENLRKQLTQTREEVFKLKTELNRVNGFNTALQTEVNNLKQESAKMNQELAAAKKLSEEKGKEAEDKGTTINRLKQIGRKYKEQAEKVTKELEDVKVKAAGQESTKMHTATLEQTISELRRTVTNNTNQISSLEAQLTEAQNEGQAATKRAEQATAENNTLKESINKTQEELTKIQEVNTRLKAEVDDFEKRAAEFEKKQSQSKQVLQTARNKMVTQKIEMEKLETENKELKASLEALQGASGKDDSEQIKALRVQFEGRVARLERELEESRSSQDSQHDRLQTENSELQTKIQQLQRQLEAAQHKPSPPQQPVAARPASSVGPRQSTVTATSHPVSGAKATASIRPMAISPTTAPIAGPSGGTPTATVMPTTVTQHDTSDDNLPGPSGLQQSTGSSLPSATVSGRVQIVEPQVVGEWSQPERSQPDRSQQAETSTDQGLDDTTPSTNQAVVTPSIQESTTVGVVNPTTPMPSTSTMPSEGAAVPHTTGVALGKRYRDEENFGQDETESKRTRTSAQDQPIPTINVIDENQQVVTQIQPGTSAPSLGQPRQAVAMATVQAVTAADRQADMAKDTSGDQSESTQSMMEERGGQGGDDVIMVLSDEEDQQAGDDEQIDEDEEDYEDDDDDDDDEEEDEDIEEGDDNDDVVIIDPSEQQQQSQQQPQQAAPPPPLQQIGSHGERLPSVGRSQQMTPFLLAGQGNPFEEDDCTVPSTPTLSNPRRADGFAEALNSPAVAQRFVFGSGVEGANNPDLAQLESQRALGMDDTRMDLSQFDEGRSAPSTPTPQTTITESQATEDTEDQSFPSSFQSAVDYTEGQAEQSQERAEGEEDVGEDDDSLLEGDGEPEEEIEEEEGGEGDQGASEGAAGSSREEGDTGHEKSETSAKPAIKKIVWDSPESSSGASASGTSSISAVVGGAIQPIIQQQPQARQALRRPQGQRRGAPSRGRGGAQFWGSRGGQVQGGQFNLRGRGSRGNFRDF